MVKVGAPSSAPGARQVYRTMLESSYMRVRSAYLAHDYWNVYAPASVAICPLSLTETSTAPAACGGVFTEMNVGPVDTTVAARSPNWTTGVWPTRSPSSIVMYWPPAAGPVAVVSRSSAGGATSANVYPAASVADWPSPLVTTISAAPAACAGSMMSSSVAVAAVIAAATPPNVTVAEPKPVPVSAILRPPRLGPIFADTAVSVGAGDAV